MVLLKEDNRKNLVSSKPTNKHHLSKIPHVTSKCHLRENFSCLEYPLHQLHNSALNCRSLLDTPSSFFLLLLKNENIINPFLPKPISTYWRAPEEYPNHISFQAIESYNPKAVRPTTYRLVISAFSYRSLQGT